METYKSYNTERIIISITSYPSNNFEYKFGEHFIRDEFRTRKTLL